MAKNFGILNAQYVHVGNFNDVLVKVPNIGTSFFRPIKEHTTKEGHTVPEHYMLGILDRDSGCFLTIHYYVDLGQLGQSENCTIEVQYKTDKNNPDRKDLLINCFPKRGKSISVLDVNPKKPQFKAPGPAKLGISIIPLRN